jgi:N-acetylmuramoyl-L-alanine amidase
MSPSRSYRHQPLHLSGLLFLGMLWLSLPAVAEWQVLEPDMPIMGQPGERILFRIKGPKMAKPYLKLGSESGTTTLSESEPGIYSAVVMIPNSMKKNVILMDQASQLNKVIGSIQGMTDWLLFNVPSETVTRQGPHPDYDRLTPLYATQTVAIDGIRGGWYRCAESGTWLDDRKEKVLLSDTLETPASPTPNRLHRIVLKEDSNGDALLFLEMDRCPEVQITQSPDRGLLSATLFDTYQTTFDIKRPTQVAKFLGPIVLQPHAVPRSVTLELSTEQFAGYQIEPSHGKDKLTLRIRKPIMPRLKGLKITVDAGHGGPKDPGTTGHQGLAEKTLNLRVAKALAEQLRGHGAEVLMTRTTDSDVASLGRGDGDELQARIDRSIEAGSQLFLSVHHNARPSVSEGRVYHGTDIYWYQPHSQSLAKSLADPIADAIGEASRTFRWRSFYVIRQTHAPAVLMEFQYLSNPILEQTVLNQPDYPEKAASGVVEGLLQFLSESPANAK